MLKFSNSKNNCYCAFCKSPRRIYRKRNINLLNIIASLMAASVVMFAWWGAFDPRVVIVFVVFLAVAEAFVKIRWRLSLMCHQCGFDPLLYIKQPDAAAEKVKARLEQRRQDPNLLLARPLDLPKIPAEKAKALQSKGKKGQLVSRQI